MFPGFWFYECIMLNFSFEDGWLKLKMASLLACAVLLTVDCCTIPFVIVLLFGQFASLCYFNVSNSNFADYLSLLALLFT